MPHGYIIKQQFKQPIFGFNYIKASYKSFINGVNGPIIFKIYFTSGTTGTFMPTLYNLINNIQKNGNSGPDSNYMSLLTTGKFCQYVKIDPCDHSINLVKPEIVNKILI